MTTDHVEWRSAPPLWRSGLEGSTDLKRPEILRFKGDDFMEQLHAELRAERPDLTGYYAAAETWRDNAVGIEAAAASDVTMKLYQPAHERFYLAAGGLVCRKYGLPAKTVDTAAGEAAYFVLRRLEPTDPTVDVDPAVGSTFVESGWVLNGGQPGWQQVVTGAVATDEERLPLSPYTYPNGSGSRTVFSGLVPAGAREKYEGGRTLPIPEPDPADGMTALTDERLAQLDPVVTGLQALLGAPQLDTLAVSDELREALFFSLLDLDDYLEYLGAAAAADRAAVEAVLAAAQFKAAPGALTWLEAVEQAAQGRAAIEDDTSQQPDAPVSNLDNAEITQALANIGVDDTSDGFPVGAFDTTFFDAVESALPAPAQEVVPAPDAPPAADGARGVYAIRFGYERPNCAPSHRLVLSPLSRPFELSSFFDPDAPVRNVRIDLSIDTSPAGLRKFAKGGVTIALSKQLRAQIERIQAVKLADLEDGDLPDEKGLDIGMICSLSIPIITICALILLMIIVSLLNIVFFWLPLFKICRPKT